MHFDLIIVGGGPIGMVCGIEAKKGGLHYLILEKGALVNSLFHFPANMTFFSTSLLLEIGDVPFISHADKPTRTEALEYYRRIATAWQLPIHLYETVTAIKRQQTGFSVTSDKSLYTCDQVIVATGFYDQFISLRVPGENLSKVKHYYDEAHPYYQQKLAVIGAGNSACDVALECWQKGAQVTLIVRGPQLKETIKYWIRPNIDNRIKDQSIRAYFNAKLVEIKDRSLIIWQDGQLHELENDFVLAMTGYLPDYAFLSSMGVLLNTDEHRTPVYHEDTLESNIPGLYLAGVLIGGMKTNKWFIENTRDHGKKIVDHILFKRQK
ncbi:MAG: YpdA family putative bacillithiol disulfide reductase [Saprospiraceae bacterium]|nr:YpdA family putative bacillithiol disulfide reductase [Saprospiraceae bacterium]